LEKNGYKENHFFGFFWFTLKPFFNEKKNGLILNQKKKMVKIRAVKSTIT